MIAYDWLSIENSFELKSLGKWKNGKRFNTFLFVNLLLPFRVFQILISETVLFLYIIIYL